MNTASDQNPANHSAMRSELSGTSEAARHTLGPWHCEGPDPFGDFNILNRSNSLAVAAVVSNLRATGEVEANARLIAAAPDLLASEQDNLFVLGNLLDFLHKHRDKLPPISLASLEVRLEKTRTAIVKATGAAS